MKMIIRADDVGFTDVCNIGAFETIERGLTTSADVMLDCPGTVDALERLREFPWISIGWHMHMWGAPVLNKDRVPSLVEHGGEFDGRFRLDLRQAQDVVYDEALAELKAQLERCIDILGRVPDTGGGGFGGASIWSEAVDKVIKEYGIAHNFARREPIDDRVIDKVIKARAAGEKWARYYSTEPRPQQLPDGRWKDRNIVVADGAFAYIDLYTDSINEVEKNYDPVLYYTEDRANFLKYPDNVIIEQSWHPGYVDYYVYRLGERGNRDRAQQFVVGRTQDVAALCDPRLHKWVKENRIELVNFRDALYGTNEYQNHLRNIGSDLCMI